MADLGAILTASVTPFASDGRVDEDAAVRLWRHLLDHGSHGIVVGGTTGEAATLTDEEHVALVALAVSEQVGEAGADAILSVAPYYNRPNRRGIVAHFREVARATDIPILVYNIPSRCAINMPPDLLAELAQIDGIVGVKQANDDELGPIDGLQVYAG